MPPKPARKRNARAGDLPPHVLEQVDRLLIEGASYGEIGAFLAGEGWEIGKTAIGRYGKEFLESYKRLRTIEEKSRALASDQETGLILEEAASRLFALMILEAQLAGQIDLQHLPKLLSDFARLQSSNVQRERLRREVARRVEKAAAEVERSARSSGLSEGAVEEIRRKILGIAQ